MCLVWNPFNEHIGTEESVLIREVSLFQGLNYCVFGERKGVLIREVSSFQVCP